MEAAFMEVAICATSIFVHYFLEKDNEENSTEKWVLSCFKHKMAFSALSHFRSTHANKLAI